MGPRPTADPRSAPVVVYESGLGVNVDCVDGNRYVDLAAGFGSLLLGHRPPCAGAALRRQSQLLWQSLGDVHPSDAKIRLLESLSALHPCGEGQSILGQSGADALTAALKTALLFSGRPEVVAFRGAYHGLSYAALSLCGLRESYRAPFAAHLPGGVHWLPYPQESEQLAALVPELDRVLGTGRVGAVVFEPIAGRAGCLVPPVEFAAELASACRRHGALLVADEIWTGLGRSGSWLFGARGGVQPDLICLGKGLGGGLPISACVGHPSVMRAWSREAEVVHTSTFAGAPLAAATAVCMLEELRAGAWVERSAALGAAWRARLERRLPSASGVAVRGAGLMLGLELDAGSARRLQRELLGAGYLVSLGGGLRESLVLTPPLNVEEETLSAFDDALASAVARATARESGER